MKKRGFEIDSTYSKKDIIIPQRGSQKSAGYDFFVPKKIELKAQGNCKIYTGIKAYMLEDELLEIHIRSSLGIKGISILNTVGIVDSDYYNNPKNEGEIIIFLKNNSNDDFIFEQGDRITQGIFKKYLTVDSEENLNDRLGGFGSTN